MIPLLQRSTQIFALSLVLLMLISLQSKLLASEFNRADQNTRQSNIDLNKLPTYSTDYDPARDAFKDGAAAVKLALSTQRHILIELGGDWCKWCHVMDDYFDHNPDIKQQLHNTFVLLKINVSDANDNAAFLKAFPKPLGYPHMFVSDANGRILWSQDTADFLRNGRYSNPAFKAFFKRWATKPASTEQLIASPQTVEYKK